MLKKILLGFFAFIFLSVAAVFFIYKSVRASLPDVIKLEDYKPLLVSQVFDRNGKKIGEFSRQRRVLIPYKDIPELVIKAFIAAEDDSFFEHKGINLQALVRAFIANMRAGRNVQGGSTITQQVAKTLILQSSEKTISRKLRDILLALQMEDHLSKQDILYLYLNQIYFGQSAYGIEMAAQTYFRKPAKNLTIPEAAMLAGLPKAPSDYSPVKNPVRAKERQVYVINRLHDIGYITKEQAEEFKKTPIKVYLKEEYEILAPFYLETLRQLLVQQLGEDVILNEGVRITTGLDLNKQIAANEAVVKGLKELDKRQGFRGPLKVLEDESDYAEFLEKQKKSIITESNPERTILEDGTFAEVDYIKKGKIISKKTSTDVVSNLPSYLEIGKNYEAIVSNVNDAEAYIEVLLPESKGIIELESMTWARKVNFDVKPEGNEIKKPSSAVKKGDVVLVKIVDEKFQWRKTRGKKVPQIDISKYISVDLDQEPLVEGSLLSIDQQTQDVLAMVGGYSFERNEYNRALQAARQTGSSFKALVYAAALEKGYNASTKIIDAPLVYKQASGEEGQGDEKIWKPSNHGKEFSGEITMRNALVKSLNIPSVKIVEDIGVNFATDFSERLGIFSKLNPDYTLVLGSSSVTLYEMTKAFSQLGRLGKRTRPIIVKKVIDAKGKVLLENLSIDARFANEITPIDEKFAQKKTEFENQSKETENESSPFFFDDPDQLIRPEVAATITHMLRGTVEDPHGTGGRAAELGREVAGKTGTTNGYVDAWFIAYTPQIATGVWVGFDKEQTIGRGEVGGKAALPIWLDYMKVAHTNLPPMSFPLPDGVKIVKVDAESGKLANSATSNTISQAYIDGTEPTAAESRSEETTDYLKRDIGE